MNAVATASLRVENQTGEGVLGEHTAVVLVDMALTAARGTHAGGFTVRRRGRQPEIGNLDRLLAVALGTGLRVVLMRDDRRGALVGSAGCSLGEAGRLNGGR